MRQSPPMLLAKAMKYFIQGRIHFDRNIVGEVRSEDDEYEVFRKIRLDNLCSEHKVPGANFRITFNFRNLSTSANMKLSLLPIPFIVAQNGFRSKTWMIGRRSQKFQGLYEWDSVENANQYWSSFPMKMMKRRAVPSSLEYNVHPAKSKRNQPNKAL